MSLPTNGELFEKLISHLRLAQECAYSLAHNANAERKDGGLLGRGWIVIGEGLKLMQHKVTQLAQSKLQ